MILYFSGTGNSEYVAKRISKATGDECLDLFDRIRGHDASPIHAERPLVVVAPTYAWRLPRIGGPKRRRQSSRKRSQGGVLPSSCSRA